MFTRLLSVILLVGSLVISNQTLAKEVIISVAALEGQVFVKRGNDGLLASLTDPLQVGDQLLVSETGSITVKYSNGCSITLNAQQALQLPSEADCLKGVTPLQGVASTAPSTLSSSVIAGIVATAFAIIITTDNNKSDKPVSAQ